jgi:hypothetical protein
MMASGPTSRPRPKKAGALWFLLSATNAAMTAQISQIPPTATTTAKKL